MIQKLNTHIDCGAILNDSNQSLLLVARSMVLLRVFEVEGNEPSCLVDVVLNEQQQWRILFILSRTGFMKTRMMTGVGRRDTVTKT